jgi:prophage DNA circulation protein
MTPSLTKITNTLYYYKDDKKVDGVHSDIRGNVSGIRGDVSGIRGNVSSIRGDVSSIRGNVSGIYGDVSGIRGNVSGISGNVSGIIGNLDECGLTAEDRAKGVKVTDLIKQPEPVKKKVTLELTDEQLEQVKKLIGA